MKKIAFLLMMILILTLTACIEQSADKLIIGLNPGIDTIEIGDEFIDAGAHANYVYRTLEPIILSSDVNPNEIGVYTIVYQISYLDYTKTITRIVTVVDETPPILALNPGVDTIIKGQEWVDSGVDVQDNSNQNVSIEVLGEVNINTPGEYMMTYVATDENGNTSSVIRYVTVLEVD